MFSLLNKNMFDCAAIKTAYCDDPRIYFSKIGWYHIFTEYMIRRKWFPPRADRCPFVDSKGRVIVPFDFLEGKFYDEYLDNDLSFFMVFIPNNSHFFACERVKNIGYNPIIKLFVDTKHSVVRSDFLEALKYVRKQRPSK